MSQIISNASFSRTIAHSVFHYFVFISFTHLKKNISKHFALSVCSLLVVSIFTLCYVIKFLHGTLHAWFFAFCTLRFYLD